MAVGGVLLTSLGLFVVLGGCTTKEHASGERNTKPVQNQAVIQNSQPSQQPATASCTFEWVDSKRQTAKWGEVTSAFREELLPDPPQNNSNRDVYSLKKIVRMGHCGEAAFVVLEKTTGKKEDEEWNRLFELYNYNLSNKQKSEITAKWPFWLWEFRQLSHFDDGTPDVVFECDSCTECEPVIILNALRFDPKEQKWGLREWSKGEQGILIGDAAVGVDGSVEEYQTFWGIADFDGSGHDEVAVWTHYRDVDEKDPKKILPAVTTLSLFSYRTGAPMETEIKEQAEMSRIMKQLCRMNPKADACKKT